jgi:teichuronic acid biosynthesis glycosyltransferase TuaH
MAASPLHWLGPVPVDQVPGLLSRAVVGLLPHRVDSFTASMSPMKLLEYLAAGLPVVATPVPGVALSSRVRIASTAEAFAAAVRECAAMPRTDEADPAIADRDWDVVASRLLDVYTGATA